MSILFLDTEFRSELDVTEVGHYKYLAHPSTELLMIAYAFGDGPVKLWQAHEGLIPTELQEALDDEFQIIAAWNSSFERNAFRIHLKKDIPYDRWEDPMVLARYMSMPGRLEAVSKILDLKSKKMHEFFVKDETMVSLFCVPLRFGGEITLFGLEPTTYRDYSTHPKEWEAFGKYCCTDVEAMREAYYRFSNFPLPEREYELFWLHEQINDYGVYTDSVLLQGASLIVEKEMEGLRKQFFDLTGIKNPRSNPSVLSYFRRHGYTFGSIGKPFVNRALAGECSLDEDCKKAMKLRLQLSKSGISKLESCRSCVQEDGRVRGLFNFMGAARTGRWSSGLVQAQNLIKASKEVEKKYDLAMKLLKAGDYETIKKEFSSPIDVASAALRPIFRAPKGKKLVIADLNAIEARGSAWVASCDSLMEVFRSHELDCPGPREDHRCCKGRDPYLTFAVQMDGHSTYEELYKAFKLGDKTTRTYAKAPTLGCCYGLSPGTTERDEEGNIVKTGLLGYASAMGIELSQEYADKAVMVYRNSYPEVCDFWYDLHRAFVNCVERDAIVEIGPLVLEKKGRIVCMWLPSGRALHYIDPQVTWEERISKKGNPYKASRITIEGMDQVTHQWTRIDTRGAKLFENAIQAICRDILADGMVNAAKMGFQIVMSCHDEIVAEVPENGELGLEQLIDAMTVIPSWGPGFLVGAAGFESDFYRKD